MAEHGSSAQIVQVSTGTSNGDITGRVMVVHELDSGRRIACGVIQRKEKPTTLFVANFGKYPGYEADLDVHGQMSILNTPGKRSTAKQSLRWSLSGLDKACSVVSVQDGGKHPNGCGIHVHSGTSCETAAEVGGHHWDAGVNADPWSPVVYTTADGTSNELGGVEVTTGLSGGEILGRVVVVHELASGARIACGAIGTETGKGFDLEVKSFVKYPGYTGDLVVSGTMTIEGVSGTAFSAGQRLSWELTGLDTACKLNAGD